MGYFLVSSPKRIPGPTHFDAFDPAQPTTTTFFTSPPPGPKIPPSQLPIKFPKFSDQSLVSKIEPLPIPKKSLEINIPEVNEGKTAAFHLRYAWMKSFIEGVKVMLPSMTRERIVEWIQENDAMPHTYLGLQLSIKTGRIVFLCQECARDLKNKPHA